jgi:predicted Zn-dependent protease
MGKHANASPVGLAKYDVAKVQNFRSGLYINTVATHELGHIFGLGHIDKASALSSHNLNLSD